MANCFLGDCFYQLDSINVDATSGIIYGNCGANFFALTPKADTILWKFTPTIKNNVNSAMPGNYLLFPLLKLVRRRWWWCRCTP